MPPAPSAVENSRQFWRRRRVHYRDIMVVTVEGLRRLVAAGGLLVRLIAGRIRDAAAPYPDRLAAVHRPGEVFGTDRQRGRPGDP